MKISLITASLLLVGNLYASAPKQLSATQEGIIAITLLDTVLTKNLNEKLRQKNNDTSTMQICTAEADRTMQQMNSEVENHVKMIITSLDSNNDSTNVSIMKKYQRDIKKKTAGAMIMTTVKVGDTTRVYKPLIVDNTWLACHDDKSAVKLGDFKGVLISEITKH